MHSPNVVFLSAVRSEKIRAAKVKAAAIFPIERYIGDLRMARQAGPIAVSRFVAAIPMPWKDRLKAFDFTGAESTELSRLRRRINRSGMTDSSAAMILGITKAELRSIVRDGYLQPLGTQPPAEAFWWDPRAKWPTIFDKVDVYKFGAEGAKAWRRHRAIRRRFTRNGLRLVAKAS